MVFFRGCTDERARLNFLSPPNGERAGVRGSIQSDAGWILHLAEQTVAPPPSLSPARDPFAVATHPRLPANHLHDSSATDDSKIAIPQCPVPLETCCASHRVAFAPARRVENRQAPRPVALLRNRNPESKFRPDAGGDI